jgi:DNA-binding GntR family transcriptional regulator
MTSPAPARADLISTVADRLRQLIVSGRLAPGAPVIERDVARRLGVSRGTARAALRSLQQEGYVRSESVEKYSRFSVAPLTLEDLADLSAIMAALDSAAARMAAGLAPAKRAALEKTLRGINEQIAEAIRDGSDVRRAHELDRRFHRAYLPAAGARLRAQWDATHAHLDRYTTLYHSALDPGSVVEHRAIAAAIGAGRPAGAQAAAERNWLRSIARAARGIRRDGDRGVW